MHVTNQKRRSVTAVFVIVFMMAFALSGGMFSTALPKIIETYNLSLEQASLFSIFQSGGMLLANCFTALVVDKLDKNKMLGVMFLLMGGFLFCIGSVSYTHLARVFPGRGGGVAGGDAGPAKAGGAAVEHLLEPPPPSAGSRPEKGAAGRAGAGPF